MLDAELEKDHLIRWCRRFNSHEATPRQKRYLLAIAKMNHDELALFTAINLVVGAIPLSDEES